MTTGKTPEPELAEADARPGSRRGPSHRLPGYIGHEAGTPADITNLLLAGFPDRILDRETVALMTGLSASTVVALADRGEFPPPALLTPNRHGWRMSDVLTWMRELPPLPHLADRGWADRRRA